MPRVIIISGDEERFHNESAYCAKFCKEELHIRSIKSIIFGAASEEDALDILDKAMFNGDTSQPLLLIYNGHGEKGCWYYGKDKRFQYKALCYLVRKYKSSILIINNCCYSFSLAETFIQERVPDDRVGVIASSGANEVSYTGILCPDIFKSWKAGIPYRIKSFEQWVWEVFGNMPEKISLLEALSTGIKYWRAKLIFFFSNRFNENFSNLFKPNRWGEESDHCFFKSDRFLRPY